MFNYICKGHCSLGNRTRVPTSEISCYLPLGWGEKKTSTQSFFHTEYEHNWTNLKTYTDRHCT